MKKIFSCIVCYSLLLLISSLNADAPDFKDMRRGKWKKNQQFKAGLSQKRKSKQQFRRVAPSNSNSCDNDVHQITSKSGPTYSRRQISDRRRQAAAAAMLMQKQQRTCQKQNLKRKSDHAHHQSKIFNKVQKEFLKTAIEISLVKGWTWH